MANTHLTEQSAPAMDRGARCSYYNVQVTRVPVAAPAHAREAPALSGRHTGHSRPHSRARRSNSGPEASVQLALPPRSSGSGRPHSLARRERSALLPALREPPPTLGRRSPGSRPGVSRETLFFGPTHSPSKACLDAPPSPRAEREDHIHAHEWHPGDGHSQRRRARLSPSEVPSSRKPHSNPEIFKCRR